MSSVVRRRSAAAMAVAIWVTGFMYAPAGNTADLPRCLFVSSYHQGYAWSDGVEQGLRSVLQERCEIRQFDMDTKRRKAPEQIAEAALAAKRLIETWAPDVVITADDHAARHLIQAYYKDSDIPFVFCGVNWTAEEYGFPYSNVTGMVEVAPVEPLLREASTLTGGARVLYIGADTFTERKNVERYQLAAAKLGLSLDDRLAGSTGQWLQAYGLGQDYDFIVLGSNSGINDWDHERVGQSLATVSKRLSVTLHGWMMPYAMFGLTKVPEEQGQWAARSALAILDGTAPSSIPIVPNRKWDMWSNQQLLNVAGIQLPIRLTQKSKRVAE